jgi:hypothetical protein
MKIPGKEDTKYFFLVWKIRTADQADPDLTEGKIPVLSIAGDSFGFFPANFPYHVRQMIVSARAEMSLCSH